MIDGPGKPGFRSDRQPRLFFLSLAAAILVGVAAWLVVGYALVAVLLAFVAFAAVTFGVGGFHTDDSAQRIRELRRGVINRFSWWS